MNRVYVLPLVAILTANAYSIAFARSGGGGAKNVSGSSQHALPNNGGSQPAPGGGPKKAAAKINPNAPKTLGKIIVNQVIEGGKFVGGAAQSVGGALSSGGSSCPRCR